MAIERNRYGFDGEITFECDECGEELHTDTPDFDLAKVQLRDEGWATKRDRSGWLNICPNCNEIDAQNELKEDFA